MLVGNDVVDLRDDESALGGLHPRFVDRVFTPAEYRKLRESPDRQAAFWAFWAAKESAYKLLKKREPDAAFSPIRFEVRFEKPWLAHVQAGGCRLVVRLFERAGGIHAVAVERIGQALAVVHGLRRLDAADVAAGGGLGASRAVRQFCITQVAARFGLDPAELYIGKQDRVPHLLWRYTRAPVDLSLSHHGALLAFACTPWS